VEVLRDFLAARAFPLEVKPLDPAPAHPSDERVR
jgi:hypothetical protein